MWSHHCKGCRKIATTIFLSSLHDFYEIWLYHFLLLCQNSLICCIWFFFVAFYPFLHFICPKLTLVNDQIQPIKEWHLLKGICTILIISLRSLLVILCSLGSHKMNPCVVFEFKSTHGPFVLFHPLWQM